MSYDPKIASSIGIATQNTGTSTGSTAKKSPGQLDQSDFLKMLVAEMQFQNPMQPQDPSKYLEQISQMSMIQGMQDMQSTFSNMVNTMGSSQIMQASSLIGLSVMAPGNTGNLLPGKSIDGQVVLPQSTDSLQIKISDASGQVVKVMNMGSQVSGTVDFSWNGVMDNGAQAPAGAYSIKATSMVDGKPAAQDTRVAAVVDSVNLDKSGVALNLQDGRQIGMKDVSTIF